MVSRIAGIVETITGFFEQLEESGYLTLDYIFYVSLALELVLIVFFLIKSSYSYELRLDRSLDGLNRWLYYNQFLDETNLIEFNNRIKRSPKLLRYHWQQYMLYREKEPSHYMSAYNCIEKPVKTSSFSSNIKNLATICYTLAGTTFVLGLTSFASAASSNIGYVLINTMLTPIAIVLFSTFFTILLRSWQNSNLAGLYQNFHLFSRYIDKACTTLPQYIDFEVLFTKDEIKRGIPVLNEFLEKRARQEQKELEEAMKNSVHHEEYDFSHLGLSGAQILERAMKETEIYLNQRQRTLSEIQQLESEIESSKRNYENNQKEFQRKMQASKENIERLRKQQEESTNRIESNYIRKQQTDEIKKQEQLEKDYEGVTLRYNQDINTLTTEINARRAELEEKKKVVEGAMNAEYKTFSNKVYKELKTDAHEKEKTEKQKLVEEKDNYASLLQQSNMQLVEKESEIKRLHEIINQSNINLAKHGDFYNEDLRNEAKKRNKKSKQITETEQSQQQEQLAELDTAQTVQEIPATAAVTDTAPQYDEFGGYYDNEGYYRYKNGTYYDPQGNFFDEFGGHYDKDGNYFAPQNTKTQTAVVEENKKDITSSTTLNQPIYDEFGGYYDNQGYYRYRNGTYYDPQGNYHDEFGGYYDPQGNYFPSASAVVNQPINLNQEPTVTTPIASEIAPLEEFKAEKIELDAPELDENLLKQLFNFEELTPVEEEKIEEKKDEAPKAKRGRPKKVVTENPEVAIKTDSIITDATAAPKRGRGRPKKETTDTSNTTIAKPAAEKKEAKQSIAEQPKRGRGRPKKVVDDTSAKAEEKVTAVKTAQAKTATAKAASATEKPSSAARRGRPKKTTEDLTEANKIRAKRGKSLKKRASADKDEKKEPSMQDKLSELETKIQLENQNLKLQHEELRKQINSTLNEIDVTLPVDDTDNKSAK